MCALPNSTAVRSLLHAAQTHAAEAILDRAGFFCSFINSYIASKFILSVNGSKLSIACLFAPYLELSLMKKTLRDPRRRDGVGRLRFAKYSAAEKYRELVLLCMTSVSVDCRDLLYVATWAWCI
jgi:hypothetical protein